MGEVIATEIGKIKDPVKRFFAYARERHEIYLRRAAGQSRPWTADPILRQYCFTNVYRELDKTTAWFREHVRDPLRDRPEVLLATVLFRMLNRIEVGEAVFMQKHLIDGVSAFEAYVQSSDIKIVRAAIRQFVGSNGPYVTGAYIISTPPGHKKLDGALWIVDNFRRATGQWPQAWDDEDRNVGWRDVAQSALMTNEPFSLRDVFEWLGSFDYLGKFHSYEIVTDLRHTALLQNAQDVNTWANMGPGARRGLNRIHGRGRDEAGRSAWGAKISEEQALEEMRALLKLSRKVWPRGRDWPAWELREVEHNLCEIDKYERVRLGEGRPRGVFR